MHHSVFFKLLKYTGAVFAQNATTFQKYSMSFEKYSMSFGKYSMTIFQKSCTIFSEALTTISHPTNGHTVTAVTMCPQKARKKER